MNFAKKNFAFSHTILENLEDFLNAPYEVYNDDKYYDLKFYTTQRAIKVYSTFIKKRLSNDIDSTGTLNKIRDSLYFIYKFYDR